MARNPDESNVATGTTTEATEGQTVHTDAPGTAPGADAATAAPNSDERFINLKLDEVHAPLFGAEVGTAVKRKEYILKRWSQGVDRGAISKELTILQGKKVPYQIVFQATKGVAQGAKPAAPAPTQAAPAEGQTATA